jgi:hypothetical protein
MNETFEAVGNSYANLYVIFAHESCVRRKRVVFKKTHYCKYYLIPGLNRIEDSMGF